MKFRVGFGYDVHPLAAGRKLVLGGVHIPYEKGCVGHSDADVLLHAVCDALLGAAALGDIGTHFPDTDAAYKNADSLKLLGSVVRLLKEKGYAIGNIDATLGLEAPKIRPHIPAMQERIAAVTGLVASDISIKATTNEKLGYVGRGEGVNAYAVALVYLP